MKQGRFILHAIVGIVVLVVGIVMVNKIQDWASFNTHAIDRIIQQRPTRRPNINPRRPETLAPSRRMKHWNPSEETVTLPVLETTEKRKKKAEETFGLDLNLNKPLTFEDLNPTPEGGEIAVTVNEEGGVDVTVKAHPSPVVSVDKRWGLDLLVGMERVEFVDSTSSQRDFWGVGVRPPAIDIKRRVELFGHVSYEHSPSGSGLRAVAVGRVWLGHK